MEVADLNADGRPDLMGGNQGLNTDLKASVAEPVGLYVRDLDNNLTADPILTYYRQGKEWVYAGLDALKKQIPPIRTRYQDYTSFASHTFDQVFPKAFKQHSVIKKAQRFESVYLLNKGNGEYTIKEFPLTVQFSPVYAFLAEDFNHDGAVDILAVGNFEGNSPSMGRDDASYGTYLLGQGNGEFEAVEPYRSGFATYGEARDMKKIDFGDKVGIIVSRNDTTLQMIQPMRLTNEDQSSLSLQ